MEGSSFSKLHGQAVPKKEHRKVQVKKKKKVEEQTHTPKTTSQCPRSIAIDNETENLKIKLQELSEECERLKAFERQQRPLYEKACRELSKELKGLVKDERALQKKVNEKIDEDVRERKVSLWSLSDAGSEEKIESARHVEDYGVAKPDAETKKLMTALKSSDGLKTENTKTLSKMVMLFQYKKLYKGEKLMTEEKVATFCFILTSGKVETEPNIGSDTIQIWQLVGFKELLYNTSALVTYKCTQRGSCWILSRKDFIKVFPRSYVLRQKANLLFPYYPSLSKAEMKCLIKKCKYEQFVSGKKIIGHRSATDYVYVIQKGEVHKTRYAEGNPSFQGSFRSNDIFGHDCTTKGHRAEYTAAGPDATLCVLIPNSVFAKYQSLFDPTPKNKVLKPEDRMTFTTFTSGYESMPEGDLDELYQMSKVITSSCWKEFVRRKLRLDDHDIDNIEHDFPKAQMRRVEMLQLWVRRRGAADHVSELEKLVNQFVQRTSNSELSNSKDTRL